MSSENQKSISHPPPLVFQPLQTHETTLIILHGRGSTAQDFAEPLLTHVVSSPSTSPPPPPSTSAAHLKSFRDHFPSTKFVFPTAPRRRAVVFNRSVIHQWFDNWSLTQPELKQHLQILGLRETSSFLHDLLREEIEVVGAGRVVLMGLSQGCAASIVSTLLWEGEAFGAVAGMCGYLPFRKGMYNFIKDASDEDDDLLGDDGGDVFERDDAEPTNSTKFDRAVEWLHEELQTKGGDSVARPHPMQSIPVFMAHGTEDEKVPCGIGRLAAEFLRDINVNVEWREFKGLGHWYSDDMLQEIVRFLQNLKGWEGTNEGSSCPGYCSIETNTKLSCSYTT